MRNARRVCSDQESLFTAYCDGTSTKNQLTGQQVLFSVDGFHGSDDLDRGSGMQGFLCALGQEWTEVGINDALRTGHQNVHAGGASGDVLGDHLLNRPIHSDLMRRVVADAERASGAGTGRGLGAGLEGADREQQASRQPREQAGGLETISLWH
jgi:hypothetical protein